MNRRPADGGPHLECIDVEGEIVEHELPLSSAYFFPPLLCAFYFYFIILLHGLGHATVPYDELEH